MVAYVGAAMAMLAWLALLASLHASREQPPKNRRVSRPVVLAAAAPRNERRASASESGVRLVTPRNVRAAARRREGQRA